MEKETLTKGKEMRKLIQILKMLFCKHEYEVFTKVEGTGIDGKPCVYPIYSTEICKRCGKQRDENAIWDLRYLRR